MTDVQEDNQSGNETDKNSPETAHVVFSGAITPDTVDKLQTTVAKLQADHDYKRIYFLFSSPGGHVRAGIHLYHILTGLPVTLAMHNTSSIDSIANVIFLAGDERYAAPGTSFLFHGVTAGLSDQSDMNYAQLRELMSSINQDEQKIVKLVSGNSSLSEDELEDLHRQGEAKGTDWAITKDLISEVRPVDIPDDADVIAIG